MKIRLAAMEAVPNGTPLPAPDALEKDADRTHRSYEEFHTCVAGLTAPPVVVDQPQVADSNELRLMRTSKLLCLHQSGAQIVLEHESRWLPA